MSEKQTMIYQYIKSQFQMDKIGIVLQADDRIIVSDASGAQMTFTCDDRFNIINADTGQMIAECTETSWYNLPSYFG